MIDKLSISLLVFLYFIHSSHAQSLCNPSSQLQGIVSGRGSTIPTKMPSIVYNANLNQFTVSIFNNNEVLSQSQCSNLNGPFFNNPGSSTFSISLVCSGPENNGAGLTGGIAIPLSNSSDFLTTVVISTGATYANIPVKLSNGGSLANRQCAITLQTTLYQILPDNICIPCSNMQLQTVEIATGPPGFSGPCCWTCLTCYDDLGVLWTSTFMWIWIDIGSALVVLLIALVWLVYSKQRRWNALFASFTEIQSKGNKKSKKIKTKKNKPKSKRQKLELSEEEEMSSRLLPAQSQVPVAVSAGSKSPKKAISYKAGPTRKESGKTYQQLPTTDGYPTAASSTQLTNPKKPSFYNRSTDQY